MWVEDFGDNMVFRGSGEGGSVVAIITFIAKIGNMEN